MTSAKQILSGLVIFAFILLISKRVEACGINFRMPEFHFPHVNDQGILSYWEKLASIDVGEGLSLPVYLNFKADRRSASPTLNALGFHLALTDANVIQIDENRFRVYTPAGRYRTFRRDKKNPNILHGGKTWKGEIIGTTLNVASDCGDRLVYQKGVISQMYIKGRRFDLIRTEGKVTAIREGGKTILKITEDPLRDTMSLSDSHSTKITFYFDERPIIASIEGQNLVVQKARSIRSVETDTISRTFRFTFDKELSPVLSVENHRFLWEANTGILISDGEWKYKTTTNERNESNANIVRTNTQEQRESWSLNRRYGEKIVELA